MKLSAKKIITKRFIHIETECKKKPKELAKILDIDLSTYYKTKRGDIAPSNHFLVRVEHKLGYRGEWLKFGSGEPKDPEVLLESEIKSQYALINKLKNYELLPILDALPDSPNEKDKNLLLDFLNLFVQKFQ
ncbi:MULTISPECIES: hypothetical protein [unclassified Leptospira]|uniref:hypothetical protein n=1 Tax=unclassified Leptospira TaxID=2633828 RepID=UPI000517F5F0|nr:MULTISPECIES: hypothetical protein [unclassified Leptospira]